jgi:hypothetical protein
MIGLNFLFRSLLIAVLGFTLWESKKALERLRAG